MTLEPLAQKLADARLGKKGDDIFISNMPAEETTGFLLRDTTAGTPIDYELPGYRRGKFQLVWRGRGFADGQARMQKALDALTFVELTLDDVYFLYCRPRHDPVSYPLTVANNFEFAVNFDATYVIVK